MRKNKNETFKEWWMETFTTQMVIRDMINDINVDKQYHFGLLDARLGKQFYSKIRDPLKWQK